MMAGKIMWLKKHSKYWAEMIASREVFKLLFDQFEEF